MLVVHDALRASDLPRGGVGTIGNYDGLHRGQRAVLDLAVARARERAVPAVVVTFDPHPLALLRPEGAPARLLTPVQKEKLLDAAGVDVVAVLRFGRELAEMPARRFVRDFLHGALALNEIYVGRGFVFGHSREGDLALLRELGRSYGFDAFGIDEVLYRGERISATRIRRAVGEGRVDEVMEMLGRPYAISGIIARGDRMGKRLGWPTINVVPDNELIPADGVYAGRAAFASFPSDFACATNIGTRPTVYEHYQRVVESHVLDFHADVYGERVELAFHKRLREERIFPSVMALSSQVARDVEATREFFAAQRRLDLPAGAASRPEASSTREDD